MIKITPGQVHRWFNVDWTRIKQMHKAVRDHHDEIMDVLHEIKTAREVNSGHTGFNVCLEDDDRTDAEIIAEIIEKMDTVGR